MESSVLARAHFALVSGDLTSALKILAEDGAEGLAPTAPAQAPPTSDIYAVDVARTIQAPPSGEQRRRWRKQANLRDRIGKALAKKARAKAPNTTPCGPPTMLTSSEAGCCAGKFFHTNECSHFAVSGRDWRDPR
jgi:hypothetical protein